MDFNLWDLLTDCALLGGLMIIGQILRAKLNVFQKLLMPASLIGGFIGLALGPSGFNILPFSSQLGSYSGVLIAIVFAAMPIGDKPITREQMKGVGGYFYQNTGIAVLQYAFGMLLALGLLNKIWPGLNDGFGLALATGFYGGHGTAAAVGAAYADYGYTEFLDIGNVSATVGLVGGIIVGMAIINWGTRKGYTNYVDSPEELPEEIRTGLIPKEKQKKGSTITISNMSLDPLVFHLAIVLIGAYLGRWSSRVIAGWVSWLSIPVFVMALVFGYIIQFVLTSTGTVQYVDRHTIQRISSSSTDYLTVSAIASLRLDVVAANFGPLVITFVLGLIINVVWFLGVSRYSTDKDWFERGILNYGRSNGVVATGVLFSKGEFLC